MLHLNQHDHIRDQLMLLAQTIQSKEELLKESRSKQEQFVLQLQHRSTLISKCSYQDQMRPVDHAHQERARHELLSFEALLRQLAGKIDKIRCQLLMDQQDIFNQLSDIQRQVLYDHLPRWHLDQQLANNGVQVESNTLDRIQSWVELLTEITWRLRNQLKGMHHLTTAKPGIPFAHEDELNRFGTRINKSLETLILKTFVVEKQPPQVMKTNTRFTSTVRFLSGSRLNVHMVTPSVRVSILSEHNARAIMQRHYEILQSNWSYLDHPPLVNQQQQQQQVISNGNNGTSSPVEQHQMSTNNNNQSSTNQLIPMDDQQQQQQQQQRQSVLYTSQLASDDLLFLMEAPQQPVQAPPHYMEATNDVVNTPQQQQQQPPPIPQQPFFQQQQYHHQHHHHHPQQQQQTIVSPQQRQPPPQQQQPQQHDMRAQYQYPPGSVRQVSGLSNVLNIDDFDPSGEILNSSNQLEYQESTGQLVCHFRNMQLKKIKRTEKRGTESVMDEKFILVFHSEFRIAEPYQAPNLSLSPWFNQGDLSFHIMAFSLPVVVIVHGSQESHAWASITWHNAFARQDELLYQVPDKVSWRDLGRMLSNKFRSYAGKGLNEQNLAYLASKVSRSKLESDDDIISWNQFAKEPLPDMGFTFYEWFHSILKLTKEHLRELWNADRIYGFVGKKGCVDLLLGSTYHEPKPVGTFLLRYSETELGGVSIAWVSGSQATNDNFIQVWQRNSPTNASTNVIMHLQPFLSKDLLTRSLADRIRDLSDLATLYPNIPKDDAFGPHYTPINCVDPLSNGYIRPMLIQTLVANYPKTSGTGSISEGPVNPTTPNSYSQSSPDGIYHDNAFMNELDSNYSAYDPVVQ